MPVETWLLFCLTEAVLCVTPGPAVLLVLSQSLSRGTSAGLKASLGILIANAMYFLLSATSLGALLLASWELFTLIKWAGAAYLVWCGFRMLLSSSVTIAATPQPADRSNRARLGPLTYGFLTQGANPKALVFFSAILPQFVDARAPLGVQLLIIGVCAIVFEFVLVCIYVAWCLCTRGVSASFTIWVMLWSAERGFLY